MCRIRPILPLFFYPMRVRRGFYPDPLPQRSAAGFSLTEILVTVGILLVLGMLMVPLVGAVRVRAQMTHDVTQLRGAGIAMLTYMKTERRVQPENLIDPLFMAAYAGNEVSYDALMCSTRWCTLNDLDEDALPRSFTLNSTLFRQNATPGSAGHAIVGTEAILIGSDPQRPLMFMGIAQAGRARAYSWGGSNHLNPIYSGTNRLRADVVNFDAYAEFKVLSLRVGGAVQMIDYTLENKSGWWTRDHLK
jgi:type II secretory pathway pseudopilin PulG